MKFLKDKKLSLTPGRIIKMSLPVLILMAIAQISLAANIRLSTANDQQDTGYEFRVDILVENAEDLYGVAFDLTYDVDRLKVVNTNDIGGKVNPKVEEGGLLDENGVAPTIVRAALEDDLPGNLVLGVTRSGAIQGVPVTAESLVLSAFFIPVKSGPAKFELVRKGLKDSTNADVEFSEILPITLTINDRVWTGDINHSKGVDLEDIILALQVLAQMGIDKDNVFVDSDVNKDGKIGLEEAVFAAQKAAELR